MKEVPEPTKRSGTKDLIAHAKINPGKWFDVTEDMNTPSIQAAYTTLYTQAGRHFTPLMVKAVEGAIYIRWADE